MNYLSFLVMSIITNLISVVLTSWVFMLVLGALLPTFGMATLSFFQVFLSLYLIRVSVGTVIGTSMSSIRNFNLIKNRKLG